MKKIIFAYLFCSIFANTNAQVYDTIYFHLNKIQITDIGFITTIEHLLQDNNICSKYHQYDFFVLDFDTTNIQLEITLTMLPGINKKVSKSKGYFYIGQRLFVVYGNIPPDFACFTKHKKRFYYLCQKPDKYGLFQATSIQEFCVLRLRIADGIWEFIEERQNY